MLQRLSMFSAVFMVWACAAGTSASDAEGNSSNEQDSGIGSSFGTDNPSLGADGSTEEANLDLTEELENDEDCDNILEVTYRDFDVSHPDFEMAFSGEVVRRGLVASKLGADSKPVFQSSTGCPWDEATPLGCSNWEVTDPEIQSKETFDQWYRDVDGVNFHFDDQLTLTDQGNGKYSFASDAFFPIAQTQGFGATPPDHINQNFLFTTELHLAFTYVSGQEFSFYGDDDLWIFVNGSLALDLGGMHAQARGTINFDAQAADLGITPGQVYRMDIFHAERHTTASNFQVETTIGCFTPVKIEVF